MTEQSTIQQFYNPNYNGDISFEDIKEAVYEVMGIDIEVGDIVEASSEEITAICNVIMLRRLGD